MIQCNERPSLQGAIYLVRLVSAVACLIDRSSRPQSFLRYMNINKCLITFSVKLPTWIFSTIHLKGKMTCFSRVYDYVFHLIDYVFHNNSFWLLLDYSVAKYIRNSLVLHLALVCFVHFY